MAPTCVVQIEPSSKVFFRPPTLTFGSFAVSKATWMHSIPFESPYVGAIRLSLKRV